MNIRALPTLRTASSAGWTFVETIVVIAIIVILTGTVAVSAVRYVDAARRAAARIQIENLSMSLQSYYLDNGTYPTEAQGLAALWEYPVLVPSPPGWAGPYVNRPVSDDPWGRPLEYRAPGPGGLPFVVTSRGADGLSGGEGNDADISSSN